VLALTVVLFIASSTDVIANFLHISLNTILVVMRVLTVIVPPIAFYVTMKICQELRDVDNASRRKTPNMVSRTAEGEYVAVPAPHHEDDAHHEESPIHVPAFISETSNVDESSGTRTVDR